MDQSLQFHDLVVADVQADTDEAVLITFDVPKELRGLFTYVQGQHITLRRSLSGLDLRRCYSICAGVDDEVLRIGVRRVPNGVFSTWCTSALKPGDVVAVMPPQGTFNIALSSHERRHHLGIAGGSGITPILSILKSVMTREPMSTFTLFYGNRQTSTTMFREELERLSLQYSGRLTVVSAYSDEAVVGAHHGMLNRVAIQKLLPVYMAKTPFSHAFICGPYGMNDEAVEALRTQGFSESGIHVERFGVLPSPSSVTTTTQTSPTEAIIKVVLGENEFELSFNGDEPSILECALSSGVELPFGCAMGVCGSCRARVVQGEVVMEDNNVLSADEVTQGIILTCQARPITSRLVLSFNSPE